MQSVPVLCALSLLLEAPRSSADLSSRTAAEEWGGCLFLCWFFFLRGGGEVLPNASYITCAFACSSILEEVHLSAVHLWVCKRGWGKELGVVVTWLAGCTVIYCCKLHLTNYK